MMRKKGNNSRRHSGRLFGKEASLQAWAIACTNFFAWFKFLRLESMGFFKRWCAAFFSNSRLSTFDKCILSAEVISYLWTDCRDHHKITYCTQICTQCPVHPTHFLHRVHSCSLYSRAAYVQHCHPKREAFIWGRLLYENLQYPGFICNGYQSFCLDRNKPLSCWRH